MDKEKGEKPGLTETNTDDTKKAKKIARLKTT